jgi:hypothetical protein
MVMFSAGAQTTTTAAATTTAPASASNEVMPVAAAYVLAAFVVVAVALLAIGAWQRLQPDIGSANYSPAAKKWRVDYSSTIAKGIASTSAGFITALLAAILTPDKGAGPWPAVLGCIVGAIAALVYAGILNKKAHTASAKL